jgi:hypothetical protein
MNLQLMEQFLRIDFTEVMGHILSYQHLHLFFGPSSQFVFVRYFPHDDHSPKLKR